MTWSYTLGASDKDSVRFLIGDVFEAAPIYSDEEIEAALLSEESVKAAAVFLLEGVIAAYSRLASMTTGSVSVSYGDMIRAMQKRLDKLNLDNYGTNIYVGGTSKTRVAEVKDNSDRVVPKIEEKQFDYE